MKDQRLANDASASTKGTIYQLYVALEKCFEMVSGQKVIVERYGDVTISATLQIETKCYHDSLTDGHSNFWNTLRNWMLDAFDDAMYSTLILCTTQEFGEHARIANWNDLVLDRRVTLLAEIHKEAEEREVERQRKCGKPTPKMPESLTLQRFVLDPVRRTKLQSVLGKFVIACCSPDIPTLYNRLGDQRCHTILRGKRDDFLNALLGFVISPASVSSSSWEVSYESFLAKVKELTPQYCHETRVFPGKYLGSQSSPAADAVNDCANRLFVQKIREIEYHEVVVQAVQEYLGASRTILEEFRNYEVPESKHLDYAKEVLDVFRPLYRAASRNVSSEVTRDSQTFFDQIVANEPPDFQGFGRPPRAFRNGLLHMHIDDPSGGLKWRLGQ